MTHLNSDSDASNNDGGGTGAAAAESPASASDASAAATEGASAAPPIPATSNKMDSGVPFEFRAVEAILLTVSSELTASARGVSTAMRGALEGLRQAPADKTTQRNIFEKLQDLRSMQQSAKSVANTISAVLDNDEGSHSFSCITLQR